MMKLGRTPEATQVLIDCSEDDIESALQLALQFGIEDHHLWEAFFAKSQGQTTRVNQLLKYAERFAKPERLVDAYPAEACLSEVADSLMAMFGQLEKQK